MTGHSCRDTRPLLVLMALALVCTAGLSACQSTPEPREEERAAGERPAQTRAQAAEFSAYEHLEQRARWLPPETEIVAVGNASYLWDFFGELVPPGDEKDAGEHAEELRNRLSRVVSQRVKLDFTKTDSAVMAASANRVALLLNGDFQPPAGADKLTMNGFDVYKLTRPFEGAFRSEFLAIMAGQLDLYMVMLDDPKGVAIFADEMSVEQATARMDRGAESLAGADRLQEFESMFGLVDQAQLVVAGVALPAEEEPMEGAAQTPTADDAIFALGPSVQASFRGSPESLAQIEEEVQQTVDELRMRYRGMQQVVPGETLLEASAGALVAYLGEGYLDALEKERGERTLTYRLPLPDDRSSAVVAGLATLGISNWLQTGAEFGGLIPDESVASDEEQDEQHDNEREQAPAD